MRYVRSRTILAAALLFASSQARAQEAMGAEVLANDGVRLMKEGKFAEACPKIAESQRLEPRPGTLFTLAECLSRQGKIATALARYEEYLRVFSRMSDDERANQRGRDKVAEAKRDELKPKVPQLKLTLPPDAPAGTKVSKGDIELGTVSLGTWLPVDPGDQVITVETPDGRRETRTRIGIGEKRELRLELPPTKKGASSSSAHEESAASEASRPKAGGNKTLGYVALGIGGVGLAVSAVTGVLVLSKKSKIKDNCGIGGDDTACNADGKSAADSAKTLALVSTLSFAVGVVGVGTGTYFLVSAGESGSSGNSAQIAVRSTW